MRGPVIRAVVAATVLDALIIGGLIATIIAVGSQSSPLTSQHLQGAALWFVVGSVFAWPVLFVVSLVFYVWPEVAKGAIFWATVFLLLLSAYWVFDDVRSGKTIGWSGLGVAWIVLWPIAFGISIIRRLGMKLGRGLLDAIRAKPTPAGSHSGRPTPQG